ncbi:MAG TPA: hypothetical protein VEA60_14210 [Allosphingosinicella sp.]|nr:hypothetical protein [Allosphingosinicella sp.]
MADVKEMVEAVSADEAAPFIDVAPFWVIWQTSLPAGGRNRIRRISQDYATAARAEADAERYRRSGAITWVEEARPLAPLRVPAAAIEALRGTGSAQPPRRDRVVAIGDAPAQA